MKRSILVFMFLCWFGALTLTAQHPIPAWNVPVYHAANFQEQNKKGAALKSPLGKRVIIVRTNGLPAAHAVVYAYSLDNQAILGPFYVCGGETLSVDIDAREWGVLVLSNDHVTVDVWIDDDAKIHAGTGKLF